MKTYLYHLIINWKVALHALWDFFAHFIHGLFPSIKVPHHQPTKEGNIKMNRDERLYKIYLKWFKLGFEQRLYYLHNPNRWIDIDDSFDINYTYKATFVESLPWNNRWVYLGYKDGYNSIDPFSYANKMPDESCIKEFFNSRRCRN